MESETLEFLSYKKIIIFGSKEVGKSTLVKKMEKNKFEDNYQESQRKI
jgi:GTPase SAR1 family protein